MRPRVAVVPLPPFDPNGKCPACERTWAFDRRCRGHALTACDVFPPHIHRKCLCARETTEIDPAAVEGRDYVMGPVRPEEDVVRAAAIQSVYRADLRAHLRAGKRSAPKTRTRVEDGDRE